MAKLFRKKAEGILHKMEPTSSLSPEEQSFFESRQMIQQKALNPLIPILLGALIFLFTFVAIVLASPLQKINTTTNTPIQTVSLTISTTNQ